jgi:hypothetical protein
MVPGLRAEAPRGRIDPASVARKQHIPEICYFVGRGCRVYFAPRGFGLQTADAGHTELADGVSKMEGLRELLLEHL